MYDFEKLDTREWQEVLRMRQKALRTYTRTVVLYDDLPAAEELVEQHLSASLSEDEMDVLKNSLVPPEMKLKHNWENRGDEPAMDPQEEANYQENELMERGDASNAVLTLNNVLELNNSFLQQWLRTMAVHGTMKDCRNYLAVIDLLSDNSFLLSFVMDAVLRHYKSMAIALVSCARSNIFSLLAFIRRNFNVAEVLPPDFQIFEADFICMAEELANCLEKLDNGG